MARSLNDLCSFEIRINEEEERMKRLPRWVRSSHESAVEELERMRHDPAVGDKEKFSSLAAEYEFSYSDIGEKIELLGGDYDSFRQIRRDGNNFYRSFLFSYLEHLMGKHLLPDADKLYRILSILEKYKQMDAALGGRRDTFNCVLQEFKCMLANVICGPPRDVSAEKYLRDCLDEQNESNGIILLRLITSVEIHSRINHYSPTIVAFTSMSIKEFVAEKANVSNIQKDLIRAEALSNALDVPMQLVQLDTPPFGAITEGLRVHMFNCSSSRHGTEAGGTDYVVTLRTPKPAAPLPSSGLSDMKGLGAALGGNNGDGDDNDHSRSSLECTRDPRVVLMYWRGHYSVLYPKCGSSTATTATLFSTPAESPAAKFGFDLLM